jgi:hypothetical protein
MLLPVCEAKVSMSIAHKSKCEEYSMHPIAHKRKTTLNTPVVLISGQRRNSDKITCTRAPDALLASSLGCGEAKAAMERDERARPYAPPNRNLFRRKPAGRKQSANY